MEIEEDGELLAELLNAFDGDRPAGEDLRLDASPTSLYFRIRDARSEARAAERAADNDPGGEEPSPTLWRSVEALAQEALSSRAKDIEVACWLTEALTRTRGLAGLSFGTDLLAGLVEGFWDRGLFPAPDPDEPEGRLVAITGLSGMDRDGSLIQPLRKVVLFTRPNGAPVPFWVFQKALETAGSGSASANAEKSTSKDQQGTPSSGELEAEARGSGKAELLVLGRRVVQAEAAWRGLEGAVAGVSNGGEPPATGRVGALLRDLRRLIEAYLPAEDLEPPAVAGLGDGTTASPGEQVPDVVAAPRATAETREDMLAEVLRIAAVFRRDEPNSPLSFTLEDAVRRARLPWPELLRELVSDAGARATVLTVSGIRPPPE